MNAIEVGRDRWERRFIPRRAQRSRPTLGLFGLLLGLFTTFAPAAETIPPAPRDHFNDYAGIIAPGRARALDAELTQFERDTSNQILVAIFPRLPSDASIEDYTVRLFQAWGVGQKDRKNGAVLFIFSQDRKIATRIWFEVSRSNCVSSASSARALPGAMMPA